MRVALYAPLKPPDHPVPSGDRRMARLLARALRHAGHEVELASRLRSYDRDGDDARQARIEALGDRIGRHLLRRLSARRPAAWLTYHPYHKSPDWLGPTLGRALGVPYLIAEPSFAPKQAGGPWSRGHRATEAAIRAADLVLAMTEADARCLRPLVAPPARLRLLPPFIDTLPYAAAGAGRSDHRRALAAAQRLDPACPWLLAVAMMRADAKRDSYLLLAEALARLGERRWQLVVVGDGPARGEIAPRLAALGPERVRLLGSVAQDALPALYAACDLYVWPAVREAYGMALLEAQAAGLPVVAGSEGGVASVVAHGVSGLLVPPGDAAAFAAATAGLLDDRGHRARLAKAAAEHVRREHDIAPAARRLDAALREAQAIHRARVA